MSSFYIVLIISHIIDYHWLSLFISSIIHIHILLFVNVYHIGCTRMSYHCISYISSVYIIDYNYMCNFNNVLNTHTYIYIKVWHPWILCLFHMCLRCISIKQDTMNSRVTQAGGGCPVRPGHPCRLYRRLSYMASPKSSILGWCLHDKPCIIIGFMVINDGFHGD
jgi:hypothetical protein